MTPATTEKRRRLPAGERRELILEAAGELFGERGYAGATLERIAAAAQVTKPILYRHFASKKALYLALLERHRDDLPTFVDPDEPDFAAALPAILERWFEYVEAHSYAWKMLFRDSGGDEEIREFRGVVHEQARSVLAELIAAQPAAFAVPADEVEPSAEFLSMGMANIALWWIDRPGVSRQIVVAVVVRYITGLSRAD